jgi:hypothetical protein
LCETPRVLVTMKGVKEAANEQGTHI